MSESPELSRVDAAHALGMAIREVREVVYAEDLGGHVVTTHDGQQSLVVDHKFVRLLEADERIPSEAEREQIVAEAEKVEQLPDPVDPQPETGEVPAGSVEEVLAWVGEDRDRAALALEVEQAREPKPRAGLVDKLERLRG